MSIIHVNQLKVRLKELFTGQIDLSDCTGKPPEDIESIFLSRALAAYTAHHLIGMDPNVAAATIVDGYDDNGIDAIARRRRMEDCQVHLFHHQPATSVNVMSIFC